MTIEEKKRLRSQVTKIGIVLGIGLAYALFVKLSGWGIPCLIYTVTGIYCPGCGISRMFMALLRLDFLSAARYNLLVLCALPFGLVIWAQKTWLYIRTGKYKITTLEKVLAPIAFVLCILFTVLRNTDLIPFLCME